MDSGREERPRERPPKRVAKREKKERREHSDVGKDTIAEDAWIGSKPTTTEREREG